MPISSFACVSVIAENYAAGAARSAARCEFRIFAADCARCHAGSSLDGVAARYPAWDDRLARVLTLGARIAQCQLRDVGAVPQAQQGEARLVLEMALAH